MRRYVSVCAVRTIALKREMKIIAWVNLIMLIRKPSKRNFQWEQMGLAVGAVTDFDRNHPL